MPHDDEWETPEGLPPSRFAGRGDGRGSWRRGDDGPEGDPGCLPDLLPPGDDLPPTHYSYLAGQHHGCPLERYWHVHPVAEVSP